MFAACMCDDIEVSDQQAGNLEAYPEPDHIFPDACCLAVIHSYLKYNAAPLGQQCAVHLQVPAGFAQLKHNQTVQACDC